MIWDLKTLSALSLSSFFLYTHELIVCIIPSLSHALYIYLPWMIAPCTSTCIYHNVPISIQLEQRKLKRWVSASHARLVTDLILKWDHANWHLCKHDPYILWTLNFFFLYTFTLNNIQYRQRVAVFRYLHVHVEIDVSPNLERINCQNFISRSSVVIKNNILCEIVIISIMKCIESWLTDDTDNIALVWL